MPIFTDPEYNAGIKDIIPPKIAATGLTIANKNITGSARSIKSHKPKGDLNALVTILTIFCTKITGGEAALLTSPLSVPVYPEVLQLIAPLYPVTELLQAIKLVVPVSFHMVKFIVLVFCAGSE
jgi:hypothetical protein